MPAIVESWYPKGNHSYGVFLEDDVEVSPLFYAWLKYAILYYRYTPAMKSQSNRLFRYLSLSTESYRVTTRG